MWAISGATAQGFHQILKHICDSQECQTTAPEKWNWNEKKIQQEVYLSSSYCRKIP